jgi:hypothetical protein
MKTVKNLTQENKDALKFVLENVDANDTKVRVTIKDLRQIDKLCTLLDRELVDIDFEDTDFAFLKSKFESYPGWNPVARKVVLETMDKLNV